MYLAALPPLFSLVSSYFTARSVDIGGGGTPKKGTVKN